MIGAVIGNIVGSAYTYRPVKSTGFALLREESAFTAGTVLTVAVSAALLDGRDYAAALADLAERYPRPDYGRAFRRWLRSGNRAPYADPGSAAAARASPVGFAFDSAGAVLRAARRSAEVTHNHADGITGAQAVALAVYLARTGGTKPQIRREIETRFGYDLGRTLDSIRPAYGFDLTCPGSVPESLIAFLESDGFEDAVRKAVSLGGDSATQACIAGAVAQAFYREIPADLAARALGLLPPEFIGVWERFRQRYGAAA